MKYPKIKKQKHPLKPLLVPKHPLKSIDRSLLDEGSEERIEESKDRLDIFKNIGIPSAEDYKRYKGLNKKRSK